MFIIRELYVVQSLRKDKELVKTCQVTTFRTAID